MCKVKEYSESRYSRMEGLPMTHEQLKRANKVVYPVLAVIMGYTILSLIAFFIASPDAVTWKSYLQIVAAIGAMLTSTFFFVTGKDTQLCGYVMLLSVFVMYAVIRLVGSTEDSCLYAFPILFAVMTYLNVKMVVIANVIILGANVLRFLINIDSIMETGNSLLVVSLFVCVLAAYGSIKITKLLVRFNKENMEEIIKGAKIQEQNNNTMRVVADNITKHFTDAMEMMNTLQESFNVGHESMEHIADSSENTAEAIQSEAQLCQEISNQINQAETITGNMFNSSEKVDSTVLNGVNSIQEIRKQAQQVNSASTIVYEAINDLTDKVKNVENFVGTILSISNQTNLLALNASIEAARAGEAGKGFAVVAEEIRKLSEDTKEASSHITAIIKELNDDTQKANQSIAAAIESVELQNDLVGEAKENFENVAAELENLIKNIKNTNEITNVIGESANVITDNISQLSALSQEVAASSGEGLKEFEIMADNLHKCRMIFESINELAKDLQTGHKVEI